MNLWLKIDNRAESPIYRQISEQIAAMISAGKLRPGEHLPPERELALQLKIARGTVKKAYESLVQQKYIVASRGKGSTVTDGAGNNTGNESLGDTVSATMAAGSSSLRPVLSALADSEKNRRKNISAVTTGLNETSRRHAAPASRHEKAVQVLADAIIEVEELNFSYRQINDLFALMLARREEQVAHFTIAVVDCNPESLGIYQKQLSMLTHMSTARFLLSELGSSASAEAMLAPFDLILTTSNHVDDLRRLAPAAAHKVVPIIVAPTRETLISLAKLESSSRAGVLYQSSRFFSIIRGWLQKSGYQGEIVGIDTQSASEEELESFIANRTVLIVPPGFASQFTEWQLRFLNRFRSNGGQSIDFEYQIERGSLLHLEELIKSLLNKSRN